MTPQELMGGNQEPLALCGVPGLRRLWRVSSAFPAARRVLWQQTAPPEASGLQWSLLATPLTSPEGKAAVLPWSFAQLPGVRSALNGCTVQVSAAVVCSSCPHTNPSPTSARGGDRPRSGPRPAPVLCECTGT